MAAMTAGNVVRQTGLAYGGEGSVGDVAGANARMGANIWGGMKAGGPLGGVIGATVGVGQTGQEIIERWTMLSTETDLMVEAINKNAKLEEDYYGRRADAMKKSDFHKQFAGFEKLRGTYHKRQTEGESSRATTATSTGSIMKDWGKEIVNSTIGSPLKGLGMLGIGDGELLNTGGMAAMTDEASKNLVKATEALRKEAEKLTGKDLKGKSASEIISAVEQTKGKKREEFIQNFKKEHLARTVSEASPLIVEGEIQTLNRAIEALAGNQGKITKEQTQKLKNILGEKRYKEAISENTTGRTAESYFSKEKKKILEAQEKTGSVKKSRRDEYTGLHRQSFGLQASKSFATERGQGIISHILTQILKAVRNEETDFVGIKEAIQGSAQNRENLPKQVEDAAADGTERGAAAANNQAAQENKKTAKANQDAAKKIQEAAKDQKEAAKSSKKEDAESRKPKGGQDRKLPGMGGQFTPDKLLVQDEQQWSNFWKNWAEQNSGMKFMGDNLKSDQSWNDEPIYTGPGSEWANRPLTNRGRKFVKRVEGDESLNLPPGFNAYGDRRSPANRGGGYGHRTPAHLLTPPGTAIPQHPMGARPMQVVPPMGNLSGAEMDRLRNEHGIKPGIGGSNAGRGNIARNPDGTIVDPHGNVHGQPQQIQALPMNPNVVAGQGNNGIQSFIQQLTLCCRTLTAIQKHVMSIDGKIEGKMNADDDKPDGAKEIVNAARQEGDGKGIGAMVEVMKSMDASLTNIHGVLSTSILSVLKSLGPRFDSSINSLKKSDTAPLSGAIVSRASKGNVPNFSESERFSAAKEYGRHPSTVKSIATNLEIGGKKTPTFVNDQETVVRRKELANITGLNPDGDMVIAGGGAARQKNLFNLQRNINMAAEGSVPNFKNNPFLTKGKGRSLSDFAKGPPKSKLSDMINKLSEGALGRTTVEVDDSFDWEGEAAGGYFKNTGLGGSRRKPRLFRDQPKIGLPRHKDPSKKKTLAHDAYLKKLIAHEAGGHGVYDFMERTIFDSNKLATDVDHQTYFANRDNWPKELQSGTEDYWKGYTVDAMRDEYVARLFGDNLKPVISWDKLPKEAKVLFGGEKGKDGLSGEEIYGMLHKEKAEITDKIFDREVHAPRVKSVKEAAHKALQRKLEKAYLSGEMTPGDYYQAKGLALEKHLGMEGIFHMEAAMKKTWEEKHLQAARDKVDPPLKGKKPVDRSEGLVPNFAKDPKGTLKNSPIKLESALRATDELHRLGLLKDAAADNKAFPNTRPAVEKGSNHRYKITAAAAAQKNPDAWSSEMRSTSFGPTAPEDAIAGFVKQAIHGAGAGEDLTNEDIKDFLRKPKKAMDPDGKGYPGNKVRDALAEVEKIQNEEKKAAKQNPHAVKAKEAQKKYEELSEEQNRIGKKQQAVLDQMEPETRTWTFKNAEEEVIQKRLVQHYSNLESRSDAIDGQKMRVYGLDEEIQPSIKPAPKEKFGSPPTPELRLSSHEVQPTGMMDAFREGQKNKALTQPSVEPLSTRRADRKWDQRVSLEKQTNLTGIIQDATSMAAAELPRLSKWREHGISSTVTPEDLANIYVDPLLGTDGSTAYGAAGYSSGVSAPTVDLQTGDFKRLHRLESGASVPWAETVDPYEMARTAISKEDAKIFMTREEVMADWPASQRQSALDNDGHKAWTLDEKLSPKNLLKSAMNPGGRDSLHISDKEMWAMTVLAHEAQHNKQQKVVAKSIVKDFYEGKFGEEIEKTLTGNPDAKYFMNPEQVKSYVGEAGEHPLHRRQKAVNIVLGNEFERRRDAFSEIEAQEHRIQAPRMHDQVDLAISGPKGSWRRSEQRSIKSIREYVTDNPELSGKRRNDILENLREFEKQIDRENKLWETSGEHGVDTYKDPYQIQMRGQANARTKQIENLLDTYKITGGISYGPPGTVSRAHESTSMAMDYAMGGRPAELLPSRSADLIPDKNVMMGGNYVADPNIPQRRGTLERAILSQPATLLGEQIRKTDLIDQFTTGPGKDYHPNTIRAELNKFSVQNPTGYVNDAAMATGVPKQVIEDALLETIEEKRAEIDRAEEKARTIARGDYPDSYRPDRNTIGLSGGAPAPLPEPGLATPVPEDLLSQTPTGKEKNIAETLLKDKRHINSLDSKDVKNIIEKIEKQNKIKISPANKAGLKKALEDPNFRKFIKSPDSTKLSGKRDSWMKRAWDWTGANPFTEGGESRRGTGTQSADDVARAAASKPPSAFTKALSTDIRTGQQAGKLAPNMSRAWQAAHGRNFTRLGSGLSRFAAAGSIVAEPLAAVMQSTSAFNELNNLETQTAMNQMGMMEGDRRYEAETSGSVAWSMGKEFLSPLLIPFGGRGSKVMEKSAEQNMGIGPGGAIEDMFGETFAEAWKETADASFTQKLSGKAHNLTGNETIDGLAQNVLDSYGMGADVVKDMGMQTVGMVTGLASMGKAAHGGATDALASVIGWAFYNQGLVPNFEETMAEDVGPLGPHQRRLMEIKSAPRKQLETLKDIHLNGIKEDRQHLSVIEGNLDPRTGLPAGDPPKKDDPGLVHAQKNFKKRQELLKALQGRIGKDSEKGGVPDWQLSRLGYIPGPIQMKREQIERIPNFNIDAQAQNVLNKNPELIGPALESMSRESSLGVTPVLTRSPGLGSPGDLAVVNKEQEGGSAAKAKQIHGLNFKKDRVTSKFQGAIPNFGDFWEGLNIVRRAVTPDFLLTKEGVRRHKADVDTLAYSQLQADAARGDRSAIGAIGGRDNIDAESADFIDLFGTYAETGLRGADPSKNIDVAQTKLLQTAARMTGDKQKIEMTDRMAGKALSQFSNRYYQNDPEFQDVKQNAGAMGDVALGTADVLTRVASYGGAGAGAPGGASAVARATGMARTSGSLYMAGAGGHDEQGRVTHDAEAGVEFMMIAAMGGLAGQRAFAATKGAGVATQAVTTAAAASAGGMGGVMAKREIDAALGRRHAEGYFSGDNDKWELAKRDLMYTLMFTGLGIAAPRTQKKVEKGKEAKYAELRENARDAQAQGKTKQAAEINTKAEKLRTGKGYSRSEGKYETKFELPESAKESQAFFEKAQKVEARLQAQQKAEIAKRANLRKKANAEKNQAASNIKQAKRHAEKKSQHERQLEARETEAVIDMQNQNVDFMSGEKSTMTEAREMLIERPNPEWLKRMRDNRSKEAQKHEQMTGERFSELDPATQADVAKRAGKMEQMPAREYTSQVSTELSNIIEQKAGTTAEYGGKQGFDLMQWEARQNVEARNATMKTKRLDASSIGTRHGLQGLTTGNYAQPLLNIKDAQKLASSETKT